MRFLQFDELKNYGIPFTIQHLYKLIRKGDFPAPVKVGANRNAWVESEITAWMQAKVEASREPRARRPSDGRIRRYA